MRFILQYFLFSGNKKGGCGIVFFCKQLSHLFIRAPLHLSLLFGINSVPHLAFYKYDKHFGVFSSWSQMNERMSRYEFSKQSNIGQKTVELEKM